MNTLFLMRLLRIALVAMVVLSPGTALSQGAEGQFSVADAPSGFEGEEGWVVDGLTKPFDDIDTSLSSNDSGGASDQIFEKIGLDQKRSISGIGGQFLATIVGADTLNKAITIFPGDASAEAQPNPVFSQLLIFGTYLGVFFTAIFLISHAIVAFFNKMEYGDVLGDTKERFVGGFRAVLAFGLVMPLGASGISGATYGVAMVAAGSNSVGNKAAEVVVDGGFGAEAGGPLSMSFDHDYSPADVSRVFSRNVAQDTCRQHYNTLNVNAAEVARLCGSVVSDMENGDIDVDYDSGAASHDGDQAYCENKMPRESFASNSKFNVATCQAILKAQRDAREASRSIIEKYDGDLDNPDAISELEGVADALHKGASVAVKNINEGAYDDYEGGGDNYIHGALMDLIKKAGWPGMGVIYSEIGSKIDAVSGVQGVGANGDSSGGFSLDKLKNAGSTAQNAARQVQSNAAIADAAGASKYSGGEDENLIGKGMSWISDIFSWVTDKVADLGRDAMVWMFSSLFEDPAPVATHKIGSNVIGGLMTFALVNDFVNMFSDDDEKEDSANGAEASKGFFDKVKNMIVIKKMSDFGDESIIVAVAGFFIFLLLGLIVLVSAFLVIIIPKLPIFYVTFLAIEWAIWCAITIFSAPLWIALNLTSVSNQPGIFAQRALSGLGVLTYLFLFPTLVVVAVVVSVIAYNLVVPVLSMLVLISFGGGGVSDIIGVVTMPFAVLLAMAVGAFVAISAITKVPTMLTSLLGIQAPGDSVTQQSSSFVSTPMQFNNVTPQGAMRGAGQAASRKIGRRR